MKTKNVFVWVLTLLFVSGNLFAAPVKQIRETDHFSKISVSSGVDLYFTQGNDQKIEVEANDDIIKRVVTKVKGNTLNVEVEKKQGFSFGKSQTIKVYVTAPEIDEVSVSGGADFECLELKCKSAFQLSVSGGADAEIKQLIAGGSVKVSASGGADADIKDLKAISCSLSASGGADIEAKVTISEEISISASSGSDITVKGQAKKVSANASSGADINIRNLTYETISSNASSGGDVNK